MVAFLMKKTKNPNIQKASKPISTKEVWPVASNSQLPSVKSMPLLMMLRKKRVKMPSRMLKEVLVVVEMVTLSSRLALLLPGLLELKVRYSTKS